MTDASERFPLRITCAPGLAPALADEVAALGLTVETTEHTGVTVRHATARDVMRLNLELRTALHVLKPIVSFRCDHPDRLYERLSRFAWETLIPDDGYVSVVSKVRTPSIDNTMFANLRVKDAIVDRISAQCGRRPDSGPNRDEAVVHLYWSGDHVVVSLDTSGRKLADRGYRRRPHHAPMAEPLCAAVLAAASYDGSAPAVFPMCGSGTPAIEAALIATDRAPGLLRSNFGFMHTLDFDDDLWRTVRRETLARNKKKRTPAPILATDIDPAAIEAAEANAQTAGVHHLIDFQVCDFEETWLPEATDGAIVMLNPEYGKRLGEIETLRGTYARIGDWFKRACAGYRGYIFTGNLDLARAVGLRTKRRLTFFSADLECRLLEYDLWRGSADERDA